MLLSQTAYFEKAGKETGDWGPCLAAQRCKRKTTLGSLFWSQVQQPSPLRHTSPLNRHLSNYMKQVTFAEMSLSHQRIASGDDHLRGLESRPADMKQCGEHCGEKAYRSTEGWHKGCSSWGRRYAIPTTPTTRRLNGPTCQEQKTSPTIFPPLHMWFCMSTKTKDDNEMVTKKQNITHLKKKGSQVERDCLCNPTCTYTPGLWRWRIFSRISFWRMSQVTVRSKYSTKGWPNLEQFQSTQWSTQKATGSWVTRFSSLILVFFPTAVSISAAVSTDI